MYGIIHKCFGVNLRPEKSDQIPIEFSALIRDLAAMDEGEEEIASWESRDFEEFTSECIGETPYGFTAYDGNGPGPLGIGYELNSWPYWELNGPSGERARFWTGIIQAAQPAWSHMPGNAKYLMERWDSTVPEEVRAILTKNNIKPEIFWTTSTS